jgi:peptidoglycan/xylan/chitin deacetylase (PgdA/CDA1 family)
MVHDRPQYETSRMQSCKLNVLKLYYYGTWPYRCCRNYHRARSGRAPIMVLYYHRVADDVSNNVTCPNRTFARQMSWLKANFEMVSLAEAQQRIRSGVNHRPCVSITFDDGYADNCRFALPLLVREQIPCTYFVSTRYVFGGMPFPHDLEQGLRFAPNTLAELKDMAAAGIEIGAHTRSHVDLGRVTDPARLLDEVTTAGEELQAALERPVRYFAFPYGQHENLNRAAFQTAYEAGYEGVCSAYGGFNLPGDDAFHIQRIHADPELIRLKNWLTGDPRKRQIARFEYENQPFHATEEAAERH